MVYQVYGSSPEPRNPFPGGFSPVRTARSLQHNISSPGDSHTNDDSQSEDLYASFSPPRAAPLRTRQHARSNANQKTSIFRPKQASIIVASGGSNDDNSSVTFGSKRQAATSPVVSSKSVCPAKDRSMTFPCKLHQILSSEGEAERLIVTSVFSRLSHHHCSVSIGKEFQEYVTWLPHGRAWRVLKPKQFEEICIPKFFRSTKYASFMRQVRGFALVELQ